MRTLLLLIVPLVAVAQDTPSSPPIRYWFPIGVGTLAQRPSNCTANRHVYICIGTGCSNNFELDYCTSTNSWSQIPAGSGAGAFNTLTSGTNTTATMTVDTGATITFTNSGVINASKIAGTTVPVNSAADQVIVTTSSAVGAWKAIADCDDATGQHLNYDTTTHAFSCGTSTGTATGTASGDLSGTFPNPTVAKVNGTSVDATPAADRVLRTTATSTATWSAMPDCDDASGQHLNYDTTTHAFSCGTVGVVGSPNYQQTFTGTSVALTHNMGTNRILVQCYNSSGAEILPETKTITDTNTYTVTFASSITNGYCNVAGFSGNGRAAISIEVDGAGAVIQPGMYGCQKMGITATIVGWAVYETSSTAISGSIVFDVWKSATYQPTVSNTITASAKPTVSSATNNSSTTLTGWTTTMAPNDYLCFNVDSATSMKKARLDLFITR